MEVDGGSEWVKPMTHILTFPNFATAGQYNVLNLLKYIEDIHCVECCEIENRAGDHATILFNSIQQVKRQKKTSSNWWHQNSSSKAHHLLAVANTIIFLSFILLICSIVKEEATQ